MKVRQYIACTLLIFALVLSYASAQTPSGTDRANGKEMLRNVINDLKNNYFDPDYLKKIDLDNRAREAEKKMDQAQSVSQLYGIIGQIMIDFDEPGTFFVPPTIVRMPDYGFNWSMVGEQCLVTYVAPDSDASLKGLKAGDQILAFDQIVPNREVAWKIKNLFFLVRPRQVLPLRVKNLEGSERQVDIAMKYSNTSKGAVTESSFDQMMTKIEKSMAVRDKSINGEVFVWRAGEARDGGADINTILRHKGVILDMRGCCLSDKGDLEALKKTMGYYTDKDVKIADLISRGKSKSVQVKSRGEKVFKGKILVLVDSETKSTGEMVARLVQLEKLGVVLGDQTKGSVRLNDLIGNGHIIQLNVTSALFYGASVTTTEVLMSDGQTLQKVGVIPDVRILPTAADLAAGRDPVLAKAVEMLGAKISPEEAGKLFPSTFTLWLR